MFRKVTTKILLAAALIVLLAAACAGEATEAPEVSEAADVSDASEVAEVVEEEASPVSETSLSVVATTTIVGDVVANVGGDLIEQQTLMTPSDNPHGYEPSPQDLTTLESADVVFVNGLGLEEFLGEMVEGIAGSEKVVSLSDDVDTIAFAGDHDHDHEGEEHDHDEDEHEGEEHEHEEMEGEEHEHEEMEGEEHEHEGEEHEHEGEEHVHEAGSVDPHVWMDPNNIIVWVDTIVDTLSELDPANAGAYAANGEAYKQELAELDSWIVEQVDQIPAEQRLMITDHKAFGYFANRYGFEMIGAVIPSYSTLSEPSAQELAELEDAIVDTGARVIFVGKTVNPALAERVATDTGVSLAFIYTGALSEAGGPASTYIDLIRYNVETMVEALH